MIDTTYAILNQRPKAFDSICMSIATNPDFSRMMHSSVLVSARVKRVVRRGFIGEDARARQNSLLDKRDERVGFGVRNYFGDNRTFPLKHPGHDGFARSAATLNLSRSNVLVHVLCLAAEETLVGLNLATKRSAILFKHLANLFEHAPRGFVGNARLALKL